MKEATVNNEIARTLGIRTEIGILILLLQETLVITAHCTTPRGVYGNVGYWGGLASIHEDSLPADLLVRTSRCGFVLAVAVRPRTPLSHSGHWSWQVRLGFYDHQLTRR